MGTVFTGAFESSIGGFLTIRGYARLSELAKCSYANFEYQRELKQDHVAEIKAFFKEGRDLFFPEIILSAKLEYDFENGDPIDDPASLLRTAKPFKSNTTGIEIKPTKKRSSQDIARYSIHIPDGDPILRRIDGNHRLTAFEALEDQNLHDRDLAPFCIVLMTQGEARRNEKALFHNINSKAKPLTSEESFKGIIDDETDFPDSELKNRFGPEYLQCRQLRRSLDFNFLPNLKSVFGKNDGQNECARSVLIQSLQDVQKLIDPKVEMNTDSIFEAIKEINITYNDERLKKSTAQGLFSAFLYFQLAGNKDVGTLEQFRKWVLKTHQYELQTIHAADLIKIFGKIAQSRKREVFVSMQFSPETKPNYEAIQSAISDINTQYKLDIRIRPIRIDHFDTGFSYEINEEVLRHIENSGLLIADLTMGNKNVYHEIGYLMGLNKGNGLKHENFLLVHNSSIGETKDDIGFNIASLKQLRPNDTNALREQVKRQIEIFYGLET